MLTITVTEACACGAKRWFQCQEPCPAAYVVAKYDCSRPDDGSGPSRVTREEVAYVRAQHPGMTLIYLD